MNNRKEVDFDILENAQLSEIEEIGMDCPMLDEKTTQRMLEITRKKYEEAIRSAKMKKNNEYSEKNTVSQVEIYNKKRNITRILSGIVNVAAVAGLIAGTVFIIKKNDMPDKDEQPMAQSTVSDTTDDTAASTENTASPTTDITTTTATATAPNGSYTQESIDAARDRALEAAVLDPESKMLFNVKYSYMDLNRDSIPELLVDSEDQMAATLFVYTYNGADFEMKSSVWHNVGLSIDNEKNTIISTAKEGGMAIQLLSWDDKLSFTTDKWISSVDGCTHNDVECSEEEFNELSAYYSDSKHTTAIKLDEFTHYASYTMHHKQLLDEMYSQHLEEAQRLELRLEENEAQYRILEDIVKNSEGPMLADIEYVYVDMNGDSKAELIVQGKDMTTCHTNIYEFNGTDYKSIYSFNSDGVVKYDFEERKLLTANDAGDTVITEVAWDDELKFIATDSYRKSWNHDENIPIYTHNDETISADEFDKALDKYESDEGELEFIQFAPYTKYYEKNYANNNQA